MSGPLGSWEYSLNWCSRVELKASSPQVFQLLSQLETQEVNRKSFLQLLLEKCWRIFVGDPKYLIDPDYSSLQLRLLFLKQA